MAYKIILDAGHGGDDPGAVYQGRNEKDDNLQLTMAVGQILADHGVDIIYTRDSDIYQTPFQKAQIANQSGADFFISFHRNSSPMSNQYSGIETLVYDKTGIKNEMAENINTAVSELGYRDLGVKSRPGLVVLRRTQMPSLLIETGFINNDDDNELFDQKFPQIADAIANAILETLEIDSSTASVSNMPSASANSEHPQQLSASSNTISQEQTNTSTTNRANISEPQPSAPQPASTPTPTIPTYEEPEEILYRVQVAAFSDRENADRLLYELTDKGYPAFILFEDGFYKVQIGAYRNLGNAIRMEQRLRQDGYSTWITT